MYILRLRWSLLFWFYFSIVNEFRHVVYSFIERRGEGGVLYYRPSILLAVECLYELINFVINSFIARIPKSQECLKKETSHAFAASGCPNFQMTLQAKERAKQWVASSWLSQSHSSSRVSTLWSRAVFLTSQWLLQANGRAYSLFKSVPFHCDPLGRFGRVRLS